MAAKKPDNHEIATLLRQVAAVFEIKDKDFFRTRAYQNAAAAIDNLSTPVTTLWQQDKLDEIPGVGPNLASHLNELFKTGRVKHFQTELKKVPRGMFPLMEVRGIGPKIAYQISSHFKLKNSQTALGKLKKLIANNKLQKLPHFGPDLQKKIATALSSGFEAKKRMLISDALSIATDYINYLLGSKKISAAQPLGSLRRHAATIGDIDLAYATDDPQAATKHALRYPRISKVILSGESVSRVKLNSGHEIDLKSVSPNQWGSLLQHYTGSKLHNIALRTLAQDKGLSLSEHGIKDEKGKLHTFKDEKSFYAYLHLPLIPPELRQGEEELKLATEGKLPKNLVQISDIKGDLHLHSDFDYASSHDLGVSPLKDILDEAIKRNYDYIGISDHNPKISNLSLAQKKQILLNRKKYLLSEYEKYKKQAANKTPLPRLLIGLEVDIRPDGQRALEDDLLDDLDYCIVSVHSSFTLPKEKNTQRILAALDHPRVKILGHPTGRLINQRPGIEADWDKIFDYCAKNNKLLEVNATPNRLDLPSDLVKEALRKGVKFVIDTDSHHSPQMDNMRFGVWVARCGWAQVKDVANTTNLTDLLAVLK